MAKSKSTVVTADKLLCDGIEIGDYVKVTLPTPTWKTDTLTGSGVGGDINLPLPGLAEAMSVQIDLRAIGKDNLPHLMRPGEHKLEVRFSRQSLHPDSRLTVVSTKVFLSAFSAALTPGGVQRASAMDGNISLSVYRVRWVEDGQELFLVDQAAETLRVGGVDYSASLRL